MLLKAMPKESYCKIDILR